MVKRKSTRAKRVTVVHDSNTVTEYPYKPTKPEIVEPKMKSYGGMRKDAGAGVVKFFKVTAVRDNNNKCTLTVKSGIFGQKIDSKKEGPFDDFAAACKKAEELIKEKEERGYSVKI